MKIIKKHKKIFIILLLVFIFCALWLFDYIHAQQFDVVLAEMQQETVMGETVSIRVRVERNGKPQAGHLLAALTVEGQGSFFAYRKETDENGEAEFIYQTLPENKYNPAKDIVVRIFDESNSVFIEVNAQIDITIHMVSAKETVS